MRSSTAASLISSSRAIAPWAKLSYARVRQRRAAPQPERLRSRSDALGQRAAREQLPRLVDQALEALEIELVGLDPDDVARRPRHEHVLRQRLAQAARR